MGQPERRSGPGGNRAAESKIVEADFKLDPILTPGAGNSEQPTPPALIGTTKGERDDLAKVAKLNARVARNGIAVREAELLADVEAQLSAVYGFDDDAWADVTKAAAEAVAVADRRVAEICRERGIPTEFRPALGVGWSGRGDNAVASRRAELRKTASTRITADGRRAKFAIDKREAEVLTAVYAGGLDSTVAREFLASIPSPTELMNAPSVAELEQADEQRSRTERDRWAQ